MDVSEAREQVESASLRSIAANHYPVEDGHAGAEQEYAGELLALAARDLVRAVEALPVDRRPVGWDDNSAGRQPFDASEYPELAGFDRFDRAPVGHVWPQAEPETRLPLADTRPNYSSTAEEATR